MNWQDWVLGVGSVVFSLALVPTLRGLTKPALSSSLITAVILYSYTVVYISLHFWFAMVTGLITAICWSILALQRHRQTQAAVRSRV